MTPTPPASFVRDLAAYDPLLRVRFGIHTGLWQIERRMRERAPAFLAEKPSPWKSPRGLDLYDGWKEGYVHVLSVHPDLLHWRIVADELAASDFHRRGGLEAMNRALDAQEEEWERQTDREIKNYVQAATSDAFDRWAWLDGRRVAVPNDEPVTPRHAETPHDGFTVVDRRVRADA